MVSGWISNVRGRLQGAAEAVLRFSRWQSAIGLAQSTAQGHTAILPAVFKTKILTIFTIKDPMVLSTTGKT